MGEHGEIYLTMNIAGKEIRIDKIDTDLVDNKERNCLKEFLNKRFGKKEKK